MQILLFAFKKLSSWIFWAFYWEYIYNIYSYVSAQTFESWKGFTFHVTIQIYNIVRRISEFLAAVSK